MCIAMEEWGKEEREAGRAEGETRGEARKLVQMIEGLMRKKKLVLEAACDVLDVSVEEYNSAKALLAVVNQ